MDKIELMKIQIIFGNNWIELLEEEIEKKKALRKEYVNWEAEKVNNPEIQNCELWYFNAFDICEKLEGALNPENWETLGAAEIAIRVENFKEI